METQYLSHVNVFKHTPFINTKKETAVGIPSNPEASVLLTREPSAQLRILEVSLMSLCCPPFCPFLLRFHCRNRKRYENSATESTDCILRRLNRGLFSSIGESRKPTGHFRTRLAETALIIYTAAIYRQRNTTSWIPESHFRNVACVV